MTYMEIIPLKGSLKRLMVPGIELVPGNALQLSGCLLYIYLWYRARALKRHISHWSTAHVSKTRVRPCKSTSEGLFSHADSTLCLGSFLRCSSQKSHLIDLNVPRTSVIQPGGL